MTIIYFLALFFLFSARVPAFCICVIVCLLLVVAYHLISFTFLFTRVPDCKRCRSVIPYSSSSIYLRKWFSLILLIFFSFTHIQGSLGDYFSNTTEKINRVFSGVFPFKAQMPIKSIIQSLKTAHGAPKYSQESTYKNV